MSKNKKPVIIVGVVLIALMVVPLLLLVVRSGSGAGEKKSDSSVVSNPKANIDFDLRQLVERVEKVLNEDLAEALRAGAIRLDFMASVRREVERGRDALNRGRLESAEAFYRNALTMAETRLDALALADRARALNESTYAELKRVAPLRSVFENAYTEAVDSYNRALEAFNGGKYGVAVDGFEMAGAILGDLEARSIQQKGATLETAKAALDAYQLDAARSAFREVLKIDPGNAAAQAGLAEADALEGILGEVRAIRDAMKNGQLESAAAAVEALLESHPGNTFLERLSSEIADKILDGERSALLARADGAEAAGDLEGAIKALEAALELRSDAAVAERLTHLKATHAAARLDGLLSDGFEALKAGHYESARNLYREAVALRPESKEAREGLERASSLYLANIRYSQNMQSAARYVAEGRFPMAGRFFNDAMASRPGKVASEQLREEERLRSELERQGREVPLSIRSDGRTFVSIIGVLPPDRFRSRELNLFPDVYLLRGTRSGFKNVELEVKVDARQPGQSITVECTERL